jgi:hypothetical protein
MRKAQPVMDLNDADKMINALETAGPEPGHVGFVPSVGALGEEVIKKLADAALEPLRECLLPLSCEVDSLPTTGLSGFVSDLAERYGVAYVRTGLDDWADSVAQVLGDYVEMDETDKLLIALKKAGVIDGRQAARLISSHRRELEKHD